MTSSSFEHLFTPFTLGGLTVRNRIVVPGHATLYMPPGGLPTDRQLHYWLAKARGGVGLIIKHNHAIMPATPDSERHSQEWSAPGLGGAAGARSGGPEDH